MKVTFSIIFNNLCWLLSFKKTLPHKEVTVNGSSLLTALLSILGDILIKLPLKLEDYIYVDISTQKPQLLNYL